MIASLKPSCQLSLLSADGGEWTHFFMNSSWVTRMLLEQPLAQEARPAIGLSCEKHCSGRKQEGKWTLCLGDAVASVGSWSCARCILKRQELWEMTRPMNITGGRRLSGQLGEGGSRLSFCPVTGTLAWHIALFGDRIVPTSPWTFSGHTEFIKSNSQDRLHLLLSFGTSVTSMQGQQTGHQVQVTDAPLISEVGRVKSCWTDPNCAKME